LRRQQQSLADRFHWWQPMTVVLLTDTNQAVLNKFVATYTQVTVQPAKSAAITLQGGTVKLSDASAGKEYGLNYASQTVLKTATALKSAPVELKTLALYPALSDSELASTASALNRTLQQHISISIAGHAVSPKASDIATWLVLTPNLKTKTVDISVNSSQVESYVNNIASAATQLPVDQVNTTNSDGTTEMLVPGVTGVSVGNIQPAVNSLSQNLLAGKGLQLSLPVSTTQYGTITSGDYPKWIEVNITTKRMYAFQYGQLVNSFLISAGKPSTPTPTGTFHIIDKLVSQTMIGPGYVQPDVPWINYFNGLGDAIHGNYWRPASVFGNINTSHGCVGLQDAQAEWVYNWAPVGTTIIITS